MSTDELPPVVAGVCGTSRGSQLDAFVTDAVNTTLSSGIVAISETMGEALEALRRFNYERIYLREASVLQSSAVVDLLRALVDHYIDTPTALPFEPTSELTIRTRFAPAVGYVSGITDRFACSRAVELFGDRATVLVDAMTPF